MPPSFGPSQSVGHGGLTPRPSDFGYVTYMHSPSKFFFQRISQDELFDEIHDTIYNDGVPHPIQSPPFDAGDLLLATSQFDGLLYRAQVLQEPTEEEEENGELFVHFLDIGHDQWVFAEDVREMPEELMIHPPLVEECGIFDLYPNSSDGSWSNEARKMLQELIFQNECLLDVISTEPPDRLLCDLLVKHPSVRGDHVSARSTLLLMRHGFLWNPNSALPLIESDWEPPPPKRTLKSYNRFFVKDFLARVFLGHCETPDEIYVLPEAVIGKGQQVLTHLQAGLESVYGDPKNKIMEIYRPEVGDYYVYRDCKGKFHRAEVVGIPIGRMAEIFLVDSGRYRVVPPRQLFPLMESFWAYPQMALRVRLGDVKPSEEKWGWGKLDWVRDALLWERGLPSPNFGMFIEEVVGGVPTVLLLFEKSDGEVSSVSEFLVEKGFAKFKE